MVEGSLGLHPLRSLSLSPFLLKDLLLVQSPPHISLGASQPRQTKWKALLHRSGAPGEGFLLPLLEGSLGVTVRFSSTSDFDLLLKIKLRALLRA